MKKRLQLLPLAALLAFGLSVSPLHSPAVSTVFAEEDENSEDSGEGADGESADDSGEDSGEEESEEPFIPEEYYEPAQSNAVPLWPQAEAIQAAAGTVMDLDTGTFLYSKNADRELYPASITKIMTCLLVLENVPDLDASMTCSEVVYELEDNASNTGLKPGEVITVRDALYALMLQSANDAANALAEYVGGSIAGFSDMMNERAKELGCTHTHFSNPSGLNGDDHYTSAHDFALIAQEAYKNPMFRELASTCESQVGETNLTDEVRYYTNHHKMLQKDSDYYQSWVTGGKTGYTSKAWNTLVTYGEKNGLRLVCVLLHGNGAAQNYLETTDLMNYGFDNFRHLQVLDGGDKTVAEALGVSYLGKAAAIENAALKQMIAKISGSRSATVPYGIDKDQIKVEWKDGNAQYSLFDWPVGSAQLQVEKPDFAELTVSRAKIAYEAAKVSEEPQSETATTSDIVWQKAENITLSVKDRASSYVHENLTTVLLTAMLIILLLLALILLIIARKTKDSRLARKRRIAEEEAEKREEEIDAKSALEIEHELREAMRREAEAQQSAAAAKNSDEGSPGNAEEAQGHDDGSRQYDAAAIGDQPHENSSNS